MKRFYLFTIALVLSFAPAKAQLVRFLNYDATTKLVNGSIYTVRYQMDSVLAKDALYLYINQTAPGSRYQVPVYHCFAPPFPVCEKEFTIYVSANDGQRLQLVASSYLSQTRGIIDSSGFATVVSRTDVSAPQTTMLGVYPNPATDYATVRCWGETGKTCVLSIVSQQGEEIYRYSTKQGGTQVVNFDVRPLATGAYFLMADNGRNSETMKIIVQH